MNVFLRELKNDARALLYWCLAMAFMVGASVGKTSGMTGSENQSLEMMLKLMPNVLQRLFGLGTIDLSRVDGVFAIIALYIALIAAFHASSLGTGAFAKEERDRTFEFLYVRGRTRNALLGSKLAANLLEIVVLNAFTFAFGLAVVYAVKAESIASTYFPMMVGVLTIQLFCYALGLLVSMLTCRMRAASGVTSSVIMALFLLAILGSIVDPGLWFISLSPFARFDGKTILQKGLDVPAMLQWMAVSAALVIGSFAIHARRDLHT